MNYPPLKGDVIVIDAKSGNIQRHMVVMSSDSYNRKTGLVLAMPITTSDKAKGSPAFYPIFISGGRSGVKGYVSLAKLQNYDFKARHGRVVNKVSVMQYQDLLLGVKDMLDIL